MHSLNSKSTYVSRIRMRHGGARAADAYLEEGVHNLTILS